MTLNPTTPTPPQRTSDRDRELDEVLGQAVQLLHALPRDRRQVDEARQIVDRWAPAREGRATLVVDEPPGQTEVDYDLLLDHPDGGTIAVNVQAADGIPWTVDHSTHWAAGALLTIDGKHSVMVPDAMLSLRMASTRHPSLLTQLVDRRIIITEIEADREPLTDDELQRAADDFRRRQGLTTRQSTLEWLKELGLPMAAFQRQVESSGQITRFRERKMAEEAPLQLAENPEAFQLLVAVWARCATREVADQIAAAGSDRLVETATRLITAGEDVEVSGRTGYAYTLPADLATAAEGKIVGPLPDDARFLVGVVLRRTSPEPGPTLTAAAGRAGLEAWLSARRRESDIQWHWL